MNTFMKRNIPLALALLFAVFSSFGVYNFLKSREGGVVHATVASTLPVVVAKHSLSVGIKLSADDLITQDWPGEIVTGQYFQNPKQLVGRVLRANIAADEPLTVAKVLKEGDNLSNLIPGNMRAVTVSIPRSATLARVLERGSFVDVISVFAGEERQMNSRVIAQAVRVLAVDDSMATINQKQPDTAKKPAVPSTMEVMLLVTPRDADWIVYARNQGTIEIVMRNERTPSLELAEIQDEPSGRAS